MKRPFGKKNDLLGKEFSLSPLSGRKRGGFTRVATMTGLAPPWTHGSLDHENEVMGKHLPPQLREPRTYWYGRTLWKHRRRDQLQREPLCQPCLRKGHVVPATDVHHLVEFGDDWNLFVTAPLESRCKACHAEAHGRRNPARPRAIGLDGWATS